MLLAQEGAYSRLHKDDSTNVEARQESYKHLTKGIDSSEPNCQAGVKEHH